MTDTIKVPKTPTDKMIRAAQHGCGLTPMDAVLVYQAMMAAYEGGDRTVIFDKMVDEKTEAIRRAAIDAAESVDIRAGNAVQKALEVYLKTNFRFEGLGLYRHPNRRF